MAESGGSNEQGILARLDRIPVWPYPRSILAIVGAGFFFAFFDIVTIGFALPVITKQFHVSAEEASWAITSGLIGYILGSFLDSRIADHFGRRVSLFISVAFFSVGSLLSATSSDLGWLIFWRFISGMGIVEDVEHCITMDAKAAGNLLVCIGESTASMGGSHAVMISPDLAVDRTLPRTDLVTGPERARVVSGLIREGIVRSAHDCSEGGLLVASVEMAMAGGMGLRIDESSLSDLDLVTACFTETPSRYLLEISPEKLDELDGLLDGHPCRVIGTFTSETRLVLGQLDIEMETLSTAWSNGFVI